MSAPLSNPNGAHRHGTPNPEGDQWNQVTSFFANSAAIAKGDAVALVWDATNSVMKVEGWDTDASGQSILGGKGVAIDPITTTKSGRVVLEGFALVQVGAGTAAEGAIATGGTTAGEVVVTTADAADFIGSALGTFLGVKDAANLAPIWVSAV
jgi:hypothetical protein